MVIAVVASAEMLLSAAEVKRMPDGARTRLNCQRIVQGGCSGLCGLLGALQVTGVIVRGLASIRRGGGHRR